MSRFAVTLDMATPDALDNVLDRHPRVTASPITDTGFVAWVTFTGPVGALVDLIRSEWEDGSGDDPGDRFEFLPLEDPA